MIVIALLPAACYEDDSSSLAGKPHVILITIDTLRADHLGCYGYGRETSPNLDRFAQDALLFENCQSHASLTAPSCASILSGFLPYETRVLGNTPLPEDVRTLPEILRDEGYRTCAVVSNFVLIPRAGWSQGFLRYDFEMNEEEAGRKCPERTAGFTTDRAVELITSSLDESGDPLFLWIHYQDPHGPYTPPEEYARRFSDPGADPRQIRINPTATGLGGIPSYQYLGDSTDARHYVSRYDGEIRFLDEHLGRLFGSLKKTDLYDDALIVFTADHGEEMGEHGYYFCHGENLYNGLTHVPLILRYGEKLKGRRTSFVQHIDIVPTLLKALDIQSELPFRGADLLEPPRSEGEIYAEMHSSITKDRIRYALTSDGFKLIFTPYPSSGDKYQLFHLTHDPREMRNLAGDPAHQKRLKDMKSRLVRIRKERRIHIRSKKPDMIYTEEEIEKLKMLGY